MTTHDTDTVPLDFEPYHEPWMEEGEVSDNTWTAGRYKIVRYSNVHVPEWDYLGTTFSAYFKPTGWKNWGNGVARQHRFKTYEEAVVACMRHAAIGNYHETKGVMP